MAKTYFRPFNYLDSARPVCGVTAFLVEIYPDLFFFLKIHMVCLFIKKRCTVVTLGQYREPRGQKRHFTVRRKQDRCILIIYQRA